MTRRDIWGSELRETNLGGSGCSEQHLLLPWPLAWWEDWPLTGREYLGPFNSVIPTSTAEGGTFTFPEFDSSLGTLTQVELTLGSTWDTTLTVINESDSPWSGIAGAQLLIRDGLSNFGLGGGGYPALVPTNSHCILQVLLFPPAPATAFSAGRSRRAERPCWTIGRGHFGRVHGGGRRSLERWDDDDRRSVGVAGPARGWGIHANRRRWFRGDGHV